MKFFLALIFASYNLFSNIDIQLPEDLNLKRNEVYNGKFDLSNYTVITTKNNYKFLVENDIIFKKYDDIIKSFLINERAWEPNIASLLKRYIKNNSIALDCGAHIGTHTLTMCEAVGPEGCVIAFEPQTRIFHELINNLKLNNCSNCIALPFGVGESQYEARISNVLGGNQGGNSIGYHPISEPCQILPIDFFNLDNVSLIKIDVEHYEDNVIDGAIKTIYRCKPVIIIEILGGIVDAHASTDQLSKRYNTVNKIKKLGYQVTKVTDHDFLCIPN